MTDIKKLDVHFTNSWTSLIGAIHGALKGKGDDRSLHTMMGLTGFAFRINIADNADASGPTVFEWSYFLPRTMDILGYNYDFVQAWHYENLYELKKKESVKYAKRGIDNGCATVLWEVDIPEFGIIKGYDDEKSEFLVSGPQGEGLIKYEEVGDKKVRILASLTVKDKIDIEEPKNMFRSLYYAAYHATEESALNKGYSSGLEAYDRWIDAFRRSNVDVFGNSYNCAVLKDARENAVKYLQDVSKQFESDCKTYLDDAIQKYQKVVDLFTEMCNMFEFPGNEYAMTESNKRRSIEILKNAKKYEEMAIENIEKSL